MMAYKLYGKKLKLYNERQKMINIDAFPDDLTIISNTCIGGRIYHDYHKKFLSPTIDFYMEPSDFIKFCLNLDYYLGCDIKPLPDKNFEHLTNCLYCDIGGLLARFGHTHDSFDKIISKWNERKKRINYNNILVICMDRNVYTNPYSSSSEEVIKEFGKIPFKKIIFSNKNYPYDYVCYLPSFENDGCVPDPTRPSLTKKGKYIIEEDGFDLDEFICHLNNKSSST